VRIFVQPADGGIPPFDFLQRAYDLLRDARIPSARIGGFIDSQGVVLVDLLDKPKALLVLTRAGLRAVAD
jgi:hypothetical protein